jgi:hypothetical protein
MDIEKRLELLKKIQKVEAPPFLLTRIRERIDSSSIEKAPATWRFGFIAAAVVVLSLNVSIFFKSSRTENKNGIGEEINSMDLSNTNDLYNE